MKALALLPAVIWSIGFLAVSIADEHLTLYAGRDWMSDSRRHSLLWFWMVTTIGLGLLGLYLELRT